MERKDISRVAFATNVADVRVILPRATLVDSGIRATRVQHTTDTTNIARKRKRVTRSHIPSLTPSPQTLTGAAGARDTPPWKQPYNRVQEYASGGVVGAGTIQSILLEVRRTDPSLAGSRDHACEGKMLFSSQDTARTRARCASVHDTSLVATAHTLSCDLCCKAVADSATPPA